jgi:hypothetical protein
MSDPSVPVVRHPNGRFGPGNPGRQVGARNRLSHRAAMAILQDFESNRGEVLHRLRSTYTPAYFAILVRLLDRQLQSEPPTLDDYSDPEVARMVLLARSALNGSEDPRIALQELDSALLNQTSVDPAASARRINGG